MIGATHQLTRLRDKLSQAESRTKETDKLVEILRIVLGYNVLGNFKTTEAQQSGAVNKRNNNNSPNDHWMTPVSPSSMTSILKRGNFFD